MPEQPAEHVHSAEPALAEHASFSSANGGSIASIDFQKISQNQAYKQDTTKKGRKKESSGKQ